MSYFVSVLNGTKSLGIANTSLVGKLLDEYEAIGVVDPDHEYDIKMVGAIMYSGKVVLAPSC